MSRPEVLEARIAPAVFLVSPLSLEVHDDAGNSAQDLAGENAAQTGAGSGVALLLDQGDRLVFDVNHNGKADAKEVVMVSIVKGQAMVFLTDDNGDARFQPDELSGLAVSDGFDATIGTDVRGDIVTALDANGVVAISNGEVTVQPGSIARLQVSGAIFGDLAAGGTITGVKIGTSIYGNIGAPSVRAILTGSQAADGEGNDAYTFSSGNVSLDALVAPPLSPAEFSIGNLTLAKGATRILAGDGVTPLGSAGGSVENLAIASQSGSLRVEAGAGGDSSTIAGAGGNLAKLSIKNVFGTGTILLQAGDGGDGATAGIGGSIDRVALSVGDLSGSIFVRGGDGGNGADASLAAGGNLTGITVQGGLVSGEIAFRSGAGGDTTGSAAGGVGGEISGIKVGVSIANVVTLTGGSGGDSAQGFGGEGGSIFKVGGQFGSAEDITFLAGSGGRGAVTGGVGGELSATQVRVAQAIGSIVLGAGEGGDGQGGAVAVGGAGGAISKLSVTAAYMNSGEVIAARGGLGGDGSGSGGGGAGGSASSINLTSARGGGSFEAIAGSGGGAGNNGGTGGLGGELRAVKIASAEQAGQVTVRSGAGGSAANAGLGGDGGAVVGVNVAVTASGSINVNAGNGGAIRQGGGTVNGLGGDGGTLGQVQILSKLAVGNVTVAAGNGGLGRGTGNGGIGGELTGATLKLSEAGDLLVRGGSGGSGVAGGSGGTLANTRISADFTSDVTLRGGNAGNGNGGLATGGSVQNSSIAVKTQIRENLTIESGDGRGSGAGGEITAVKVTAPTVSAEVNVIAGEGGTSIAGGGAGGAVTNLNLAFSSFVEGTLTLAAGSGGSGTGGSSNGAGGSIEKVSIRAQRMDDFAIESGSGGANGIQGLAGNVDAVSIQVGAIDSQGFSTIEGGDGLEGGDLTNISVKITAGALNTLKLEAGNGLANGGDVERLRIDLGRDLRLDALDVFAGEGRGGASGTAGAGGSVIGLTVVSSSQLGRGLILGGQGGSLIDTLTGGSGGSVTGVNFTNNGSISDVISIDGGDGGNGDLTGGLGGNVLRVNLTNNGAGNFAIESGDGGSADFVAGTSGALGGSVSAAIFKDRIGGTLSLDIGSGGSGGAAGNAGVIDGVKLTAPLATVLLGFDELGAGGESAAGTGGVGAGINAISGKVGFFAARAGAGGDGVSGGLGGDIQGIKLVASIAVQQLRAGQGGEATSGTGGAGGSIASVQVRGDIGNFAQPFGIDLDEMGGLIAGKSGGVGAENGSISNVQATRIAAIFAADDATRANNLTIANTVFALTNVKASTIGADLDGDEAFDFIDNAVTPNGTFGLGEGDTAVDGLVIAPDEA